MTNFTNDHHLQNYLKHKIKDQKELIRQLRLESHDLRFKNLQLRLDMQVLIERPDSKAADRIRHRHNIKRAIHSDCIEHMMN